MSNRWPAGIIRRTPITPAGPNSAGAAPGVWTMREAAYWRAQGLWPDANSDPQWSYVAMLLSTTAVNGAQNNTFLDSSTNNYTVTRLGNTTQGSFNPFNVAWSNYFDGNGDYLTAPDNAALQLSSTDFTVECWVNFAVVPGASQGAALISKFDTSNTGYEVVLFNNTIYFQAQSANIGLTAAWTPVTGRWYHLAWTRSGANSYGFIDGVLVASTSAASGAISNLNQALQLGRRGDNTFYLNGYLSNVRIIKGTALYTAAFTPPSTQLTAVGGTSLLTCQSNGFRDNGPSNFPITRNGDVAVTDFSPFTTQSYTTTNNGGSMYLDGSGDYLSYPQASGSLGTNDWTMECWVYATTTPVNYASILNKNWTFSLTNGDFQWALKHDDGFMSFAYVNGSIVNVTSTIAPAVGAWRHYAVTRSGTTLRIYADGVLNRTATLPSSFSFGTNSTTSVFTGYNVRDGAYLTGYISGLRVLNGTALYTGSTYTVPTAPPTAITNTSLLINSTNAGIFDAATLNDMETVGNAQVSTAQAKFGTTSVAFDGNGDWLFTPLKPELGYGTGDFTIEFWAYPNNSSGVQVILDQRAGSANRTAPTIYLNSGSLRYYTDNADRITGGTVTAAQWSHIAVCRSGSSTRMFINGVQTGSTLTDTRSYIPSPVYVGEASDGVGGAAFNGYIDELRITKGVARYTANFTPPAAAFPTF